MGSAVYVNFTSCRRPVNVSPVGGGGGGDLTAKSIPSVVGGLIEYLCSGVGAPECLEQAYSPLLNYFSVF